MVEDVVNVVEPLPWQRVVPPVVGTGTVGRLAHGFTVTLRVVAAVMLPLQLTALTVMVAVPLKALFHVTVPVAPVPLILPAPPVPEGEIDH